MRKTKEIIAILLVFLVVVGGCGNKKPSGVSDEMYETAVKTIKIVDLYLDGEDTLEETSEKLSEIKIPDSEIGGEYENDFSVSIQITPFKTTILSIKLGTATVSDLKEDRDALAESINYKD